MKIGRPRIFVTQADRQKAYRERLKDKRALRNPPINEIDAIENEHTRLLSMAVPQVVMGELSYGGMSHDVWYGKLLESHQRWAKAKGLE